MASHAPAVGIERHKQQTEEHTATDMGHDRQASQLEIDSVQDGGGNGS